MWGTAGYVHFLYKAHLYSLNPFISLPFIQSLCFFLSPSVPPYFFTVSLLSLLPCYLAGPEKVFIFAALNLNCRVYGFVFSSWEIGLEISQATNLSLYCSSLSHLGSVPASFHWDVACFQILDFNCSVPNRQTWPLTHSGKEEGSEMTERRVNLMLTY